MKYKYHDIIEEMISPIIAAFIVIVNSLVIYYIVKYRNTQHNPIAMVYLLNMAIGDFFVGFVMIMLQVCDVIMEQHGSPSNMNSYYTLRNGLIRLSLFVSVLNLIPLTIDRLWAVRYPISHRQSKKNLAVKICVAVWASSILFVIAFHCIVHFNSRDTERFNKMIFPVATYPTSLVFIVCYSIIFRALKNSRKYRERTGSRSLPPRTHSISTQVSLESNTAGSVLNLSKSDEKKNEVKFLQLAIKTVVIFIVCWFPIATCGLPILCECSDNVEITFLTLGYLNAAVTPLLYYSHIRQALQQKLRRFTIRKQMRRNSSLVIADTSDTSGPKNTSHMTTDNLLTNKVYTITNRPQ